MAVIAILHNPELAIDEVVSIFRRHFEPRYNVDDFRLEGGLKGDEYDYPTEGGYDFAIRKNAWLAVGVTLKQEPDKTKFVVAGTTPSRRALWLLKAGGFALGFGWLLVVLPYLLLSNGVMNEVKTFIREAPEFK